MAGRPAGRGQPHLPPPAAEFAKCAPDLLSAYPSKWMRLGAVVRPSPYDWDDRAVSRFSHPSHPFKILYLADSKETAFWEVFGAKIEDMPVDNRALYAKAQLQTRKLIEFRVEHVLRLIDVTQEKIIHDLRSNAGTFQNSPLSSVLFATSACTIFSPALAAPSAISSAPSSPPASSTPDPNSPLPAAWMRDRKS